MCDRFDKSTYSGFSLRQIRYESVLGSLKYKYTVAIRMYKQI